MTSFKKKDSVVDWMEKEVKKDIIDILKAVVAILKEKEEKDIIELKEVSNHTLHDASIYQDIDSVEIAVLVYSVYKLLDRRVEISSSDYKKILDGFVQMLDGISRNNFKRYNLHMQKVFRVIEKIDKQVKMYFEEVIDKARITKGSKIFEHGLSAKRAADIMGVTEWELLKHIGRTQIFDKYKPGGIGIKPRLSTARRLFDL